VALDLHWNAGDEKNDAVGNGGDLLVELTEQIAVQAAALEGRDNSAADLIRDDEDRRDGILNGMNDRIQMTAVSRRDATSGNQPSAVNREAVDEQEISAPPFSLDDPIEITRSFDGLPRGRALASMGGNLAAHFGVGSPRGCHKRHTVEARGLDLRVAALATAYASQYERHGPGAVHGARPAMRS
jgi:hypothetical protein